MNQTRKSKEGGFDEASFFGPLVILLEVDRMGGPHSTVDRLLASRPAAPGSILRSGDIFGKKLRFNDSRTA